MTRLPPSRPARKRSEAVRERRRSLLAKAKLACLAITLATLGVVGIARPAPQEEIPSGNLRFVFWPGQRGAADALSEAARDFPPMPGLPRDILAGEQLTIYLAPNQSAFDSLAPGAPDWSGGIAFPEGDQIVLPTFAPRAGGRSLVTVLRHELAHVALGRYLGPRVPQWFHEGYAQLASGSWRAGDAWTLRFAIMMGRLPSLQSLDLDFRRGSLQADHAYLLSYTAVEYLYRLGGPNGFTRLLERWRETSSLDRAVRRTYGLTLSQVEKMWRRDVSRRFGWLLVLTQTAVYWTSLTILLLVMGYWKRQRTRRKLMALEAAAQDLPDVYLEDSEEGHTSGKIDGDRGFE
jgi:hypothetical protein